MPLGVVAFSGQYSPQPNEQISNEKLPRNNSTMLQIVIGHCLLLHVERHIVFRKQPIDEGILLSLKPYLGKTMRVRGRSGLSSDPDNRIEGHQKTGQKKKNRNKY